MGDTQYYARAVFAGKSGKVAQKTALKVTNLRKGAQGDGKTERKRAGRDTDLGGGTMPIKPIETIYNGYRFRSRLEARWAVFFDALGIKYEYEREGYETPDGYYLPDFWLPETKTFIEVKPAKHDPSGEMEWPGDSRWAAIADHFRLIVLCGTPGPIDFGQGGSYPYQGFYFDEWSSDCSYYWGECPECGCIDIQYEGRTERNRNHKPGCSVQKSNRKCYNTDTSSLRAAYAAARQARFEYEDKWR